MPILSQFYLKESFVGDKDSPLGWGWERALSGVGVTESHTAPFAPAVQVFRTGQMMFKGIFRGLSDSLASPDLFPSSCEHCGHAHRTSFDLREWRSCQYSISQTAGLYQYIIPTFSPKAPSSLGQLLPWVCVPAQNILEFGPVSKCLVLVLASYTSTC